MSDLSKAVKTSLTTTKRTLKLHTENFNKFCDELESLEKVELGKREKDHDEKVVELTDLSERAEKGIDRAEAKIKLIENGDFLDVLTRQADERAEKATIRATSFKKDLELELPCLFKGKYFKKLNRAGAILTRTVLTEKGLVAPINMGDSAKSEVYELLTKLVKVESDEDLVHNWLLLKTEGGEKIIDESFNMDLLVDELDDDELVAA
tara:strand:- start:312 stop:935 length:624 start_codon:yes stop_codon:yes gene_type:complete